MNEKRKIEDIVGYINRLHEENINLKKQLEVCTCDKVKQLLLLEERSALQNRVFARPITDIDISRKAYNRLKSAGITSIEELLQSDIKEVVKNKPSSGQIFRELESFVIDTKKDLGI
jgi:DNA-directed RNA polymerase alpha subunit